MSRERGDGRGLASLYPEFPQGMENERIMFRTVQQARKAEAQLREAPGKRLSKS